MPKIEGLLSLQKKLDALIKGQKKKVSVQVGYTQKYALIVHEDMEAHHNVGQAKYLESPARSLKQVLSNTVRKVYKKTKSLEKALLVAGLRLQRESQKLVPVDTSALRASAYTALNKDVETASRAAFDKSEAIRKGEKVRDPFTGRFIKRKKKK